MPPIKGFAESWGISVLHCPYCHGYEVKNQVLDVIANGEMGLEYAKMISNWSKKIILFTNGKPTFNDSQIAKLKSHGFQIIEDKILELEHTNGFIRNILLKNGKNQKVSSVFVKAPFKQHTEIPAQLGCEINEQGLIKVRTTVPGIFAAGDNCTLFRSVSRATFRRNQSRCLDKQGTD